MTILQKMFPLIISISLLLLPCMAAISFQPFAVADANQTEVVNEVLRDDVEQPAFTEPQLQETDSTENSVPADDTENKSGVIAPVFYHSTIYDANGEPENQFTVQAGSEGIEEGSVITTITYINDIEIGKIKFTVAKRIDPFAKVAHNLSVRIPKNLTNSSGKVTAAVYLDDVKLGLGESKDNTIEIFDPANIKTLNFTVPISDALLEVLNAKQTTTSISSDDISTNISILYDNIVYNERVLIPGKQLTVLLDIANNTDIPKDVNLFLALYDINSKLINSHVFPCHLNGNDSDTFAGFINVPADNTASYAKIMVWDSEFLMPYCAPIVLMPKFGNSKAFSTLINGSEFYSDMSDNASLYKDGVKVYAPKSTWLSAGNNLVYFNSDGLKGFHTVSETVDSLHNGNPYYIVSDGDSIFYADWNDGGKIYKYTFGNDEPILVCKDSAIGLEIIGNDLQYKNVKDGGKPYRVSKNAVNAEYGIEIK